MPFNDINDYYRFLDPKIDLETGQVYLADPTKAEGNKSKDVDKVKVISNKYINSTTPGSALIDDPELKSAAASEPSPPDIYFSTIYQAKNGDQTKKLFDDDKAKYWNFVNEKNELIKVNDYYAQVCEVKGGQPPVDLTINVLRSPLISPARRDVDEITLFLNHMPTTFASNMVPYLDVDFQLPVTSEIDTGSGTPKSLNRPSLLRFLIGSQSDVTKIPLTAADASLINVIDTPNKFNENSKSTFVGMEYFTTPQTLTNMDGLTANADRLNDVQPFLPPATLLSANISIRGLYYDQKSITATLDFKIHDKNRLSEFSEFIRGPGGYNSKAPGGSVTVWLTFGWLAPRGNEHDEYARFINSKMLRQIAFYVGNSSFSFDALGQATVSLQLHSRGGHSATYAALDKGPDAGSSKALEEIYKNLEGLIENAKENRELFGQPPEGLKEIRIYQLLDAAADGNYNTDIPLADRKKVIDAFKEKINQDKTVLRGDDKRKALEQLEELEKFFALKKTIATEIRNYVSQRLDKCYDSDSPDPFIPTELKKQYFSSKLIKSVENSKINYKDFDTAAAQALTAWQQDKPTKSIPVDPKKFQRSVISFGKLFSIFCLPSLLESCKNENISELQINFYQFNGLCGPMSYHNIAEFPIDVRQFVTQFQSYVEKQGTTRMTVDDFVAFVMETQLSDLRSRAWGMQDLYTPYSLNDTELKKSADFDKKLEEWTKEYREFQIPALTMYSETTTSKDSPGNVDLLSDISSRVGGYYNTFNKKGLVKKIHIYDRTHSPYKKLTDRKQRIFDAADGSLISIAEEDIADFARGMTTPQQVLNSSQAAGSSARIIPKGRNALRELYSNTIPTITYGTEGTMVRSFSLSSKADGTIGAINLLGGSHKASSTLSPNGLQMAVNKLPIRVFPAQMTMTSAGCPIASLHQQFYIDLGTGTTLDNTYQTSQVQHSITPGRFETSWTFVYMDGYGKLFSPGSFDQLIKEANPPPPPPDPPKKPATKKK